MTSKIMNNRISPQLELKTNYKINIISMEAGKQGQREAQCVVGEWHSETRRVTPER